MKRTILITGSTDGIGLVAATQLAEMGHTVLLHGRSPAKLARVQQALPTAAGFVADLSRFEDIDAFAAAVRADVGRLDVLINNAGVFKGAGRAENGLDLRFMVNTIAPYLLTRRLLPMLDRAGRIINVSSAAQAPVDLRALTGQVSLSTNAGYAQSKLALNMWSADLARRLGERGPVVIAVNPGSMLGTKMVKQAFGVSGADINIGGDILVRTGLSDEFAGASGRYFDNDRGQLAAAHPDMDNTDRAATLTRAIDAILKQAGISDLPPIQP
ncbi:MAG: SDR family NAD(P)-dependent oxidoreductase [Myxococcota bacterium]